MSVDPFADLADPFAKAYASVKGRVRNHVLHHQLLEHLPEAPASILDVGGGAGHQSFPLAKMGYDVTILDPSETMLSRAQERMARLSDAARERVTLVKASGEDAEEVMRGRTFEGVLCHGVLGYLDDPRPLIDQLCRCCADEGIVSIMTANAKAASVKPAMQQRWDEALKAFDTATGVGVLGVQSRADTVEDVTSWLGDGGVTPLAWYGVWLFVDWLEFAGVEIDTADRGRVASIIDVEIEAARRDPYRQLSRVFHLMGRKGAA